MFDQRFASRSVAGNDVDHTRGKADFVAQLREGEGGERRKFRGLQNHRVAGGESGRDFPRQHEQRKIPGNDLADDAAGFITGKFAGEKLGPAGVMVEVAGNERNINIAAFADGFAVVERFEDGQAARVLLDLPGKAVEKLGALVAGKFFPCGKSLASGLDCSFDVGCGTLRNIGDFFAGGRVGGVEVPAFARTVEAAIDEVAEAAVMLIESKE